MRACSTATANTENGCYAHRRDQPLTNCELRTVNRKPLTVQWATAAPRRSLPTMGTPGTNPRNSGQPLPAFPRVPGVLLAHPPSLNYSLGRSHTRCTHHRHRPESPSNFRSECR
jgi:hypothetical protein